MHGNDIGRHNPRVGRIHNNTFVFDALTDILFRPFIRTPRKGAATAVGLLLDEDAGKRTGTLNASCRPKSLSEKYTRHVQMEELWERTESIVKKWL